MPAFAGHDIIFLRIHAHKRSSWDNRFPPAREWPLCEALSLLLTENISNKAPQIKKPAEAGFFVELGINRI